MNDNSLHTRTSRQFCIGLDLDPDLALILAFGELDAAINAALDWLSEEWGVEL